MITVIFATRDRAEGLGRVLDTYRRLEPPPGGWKLIVVDNGSRDATAATLDGYADLLPLTRLDQPRPGKNRALNRALTHAEGDLVVFTDDDVLPAPDWLRQLRRAADEHPAFDLFGGAIRPAWPGEPPAWLFSCRVPLGLCYSINQRDSGPCSATVVWGPNMAVRASVFAQGFRFNEEVGPDGTVSYGMGSETEFNRRLEEAGHSALHVGDAVVQHIIRPEQLSERWILGRGYRHGAGFHRYGSSRYSRSRLRVRGFPVTLALWSPIAQATAALVRPLPRSRLRFRILFHAQWVRGVTDDFRRRRLVPPAGDGPTPRETAAASSDSTL